MARKRTSSTSSDVEKPPATGRTRPLPTGIVSGFRRLSSFQGAALVSTLAPLLDPGEVEPGRSVVAMDVPHLDKAQADALMRFDEATRSLAADEPRMCHLATKPASVRFALGLDVEDPVDRWRAVVSRAFARSDAVAWCLAEGIEDDAALVAWAENVERMLGFDAYLRFERAWVRRFSVPQSAHEEMSHDLVAAMNHLRDRAEMARRCAAETTTGGRTPVTARDHFVLALATVYALATGDAPLFDGGDQGDEHKVGTERKRPHPWHALIGAALDLTGLRGGATTDAVLRKAGGTWGAIQVGGAAERGLLSRYPSLPFTGLEIDVGCHLDMPATRAETYAHPKKLYVGRSRRG